MNSDRSSHYFRPSLLDRLLEGDADGLAPERRPRDHEPYQLQSFAELTVSICRDLEDLLNARSASGDVPPWAKHCATSILNYGLPEAAYAADPAHAARIIRDTIATFEPRLCDVEVEPLGFDTEPFNRGLLEIRARLLTERGTSLRLWARFRSIGMDRIMVTRPD
jgi:type VI secretion system lysozyme-like protein